MKNTENEKYLWCPKCENFPDRVIERYEGTHEEIREWDGNFYDIVDVEYGESDMFCSVCGTRLDELVPQDRETETDTPSGNAA